MKKLKWLFFCSMLAALSYSCSSDFDITGEYKDITIVYGMLESGQDTHYIKITKGFLGEGDANVYAQVADSSTYPDILDVKVEVYENLRLINTVPFERTIIHDKEEGVFYGGDQVVYRGVSSFEEDNDENTIYNYKLIIKNNESGKIISSETTLVGDFEITRPWLTLNLNQVHFEGVDNSTTLKWTLAPNARKYEAVMDFYYTEKKFNQEEQVKEFRWGGIANRDIEYVLNETAQAQVKHEAFYNVVKNRVPYADASEEDQVEYRIADSAVFRISVAGVELSTFLDVNDLSGGLTEDTPDYSNVDNGIGVFSSRKTIQNRYFISGLTTEELKLLGLKFKSIID
ncbi:MAG: DUF4249 family protein [Bacteroidales bacterium]|nr:DUF4249 family protein [Bacteroidales bacterium]